MGYQAQVAGQRTGGESSWALWVMKLAADAYQWRFTRTAVDAGGKVTQSAEVPADDIAETGTWVQLTGVFDAYEPWEWTDPADPSATGTRYGALHLYVGDSPQEQSEAWHFDTPQQGSGELALGRGASGGSAGNYLPGSLGGLRVWTGAMTSEQIFTKVLATP